ncbi:unnamed protein product, partial [Adineta steineri]
RQCPQWWAMGRQLYENEPLFNEWIHLIDGEMTKINNGEWKLFKELIEKKTEQESRINDLNAAQPTLFAIQVALAALLISWNIYPPSIISHSAGDQAAAFVAARLSLEEAVRVVYHRLRLQNRNTRQGGRMLAVSMSEEEVENKLLKDIEHLVCITIVNSLRSLTISGDEIQQILSISYPNVFKARLRIENAFHYIKWIDLKLKKIYEAANVFLEISPHPVLAKSIRECYELTNQQQSSPLILPTLKRKENEQITLLPTKNYEEYFNDFLLYKFHLSPCWYESKDSSVQRLANRISIHPLLGIRQLNEQTSATWKSLININLLQYSFLKDHKIQDAILFPAVAYLDLATAACQQLLSPKEDDQTTATSNYF